MVVQLRVSYIIHDFSLVFKNREQQDIYITKLTVASHQQKRIVVIRIALNVKANRTKALVRAGDIGALRSWNSHLANGRRNGAFVHV
jgi:hypothetical protein